jgi:protein SCO1/2
MAFVPSKAVCQLLISKLRFDILAAIMILLTGCDRQLKSTETLPFYNTADFTAEWITPDEPRYKTIHTIRSFALYDQLGHVFTSDSLKGKVYVANFFFTTCPSICPKMVSNLAVVQQSFATSPELELVSFSVMPWVDSVGRLNEYGKSHAVNPKKWHLLTGDREKIYTLGRRAYFAEKGVGLLKDSTEFLHTESMLLIDKKARIRGIYNATQPDDIARITDDIKILLNESEHPL